MYGQKQKGHMSFQLLECCQCHQSPETKGHMYAKVQRTCDLLAIGVLSMSSKSGDKGAYVWAKAQRTCVLLAMGEQEREILNAEVKVRRQKKK